MNFILLVILFFSTAHKQPNAPQDCFTLLGKLVPCTDPSFKCPKGRVCTVSSIVNGKTTCIAGSSHWRGHYTGGGYVPIHTPMCISDVPKVSQ